MPKDKNQKYKLYYLSKILLSKTDEDHHLSMPEILEYLEQYDISADRKTIYSDIATLKELGLDIIGHKNGKTYDYYVGSKTFDLAELKLLVDSIQASKFITEKKSKALIEKISSFASEYEAEQLKRQVVVQGRVKAMNETIYYNVDEIYRAINENQQITFEYMQWTPKKKLEKKREDRYEVSPWALTWAEENYYLIAYDEKKGRIHHYRVDKIKNIDLTGKKRVGRKEFKEFNVADYVKMNFGMFGGEQMKVKIACRDELIGILFDRFGTNIPVKEYKKGWSETEADVLVSDHFLAWIFALGDGVKITGPKKVTDKVDAMIERLKETYQ